MELLNKKSSIKKNSGNSRKMEKEVVKNTGKNYLKLVTFGFDMYGERKQSALYLAFET